MNNSPTVPTENESIPPLRSLSTHFKFEVAGAKETDPLRKNERLHHATLYGGIAAGIVLFIAVVVLTLLCMKKRKMKKQTEKYLEERIGDKGKETTIMLENGRTSARFTDLAFDFSKNTYTYNELALATNKFSADNLVGEGGFGKVYKGVLPNGEEVAVKILQRDSCKGDREFRSEIKTIGRLHHRHLVSLIGYCISGADRILVYPYIANKTFEYHLHDDNANTLNWADRLKIALGTAKGLAFLHEDCHPRIIHRDIKAANILLDITFEPKIADFGLSKLISEEEFTKHTSRIMGTCGYLAPEYERNGKITEKVDVFSFGIVLLELITGRRNTDPTSDQTLVELARPLLASALEDGNFSGLLDRRLNNAYDPIQMTTAMGCAAAAIQKPINLRPRMSQIARAMEGLITLSELNGSVLSDHIMRVDSNG